MCKEVKDLLLWLWLSLCNQPILGTSSTSLSKNDTNSTRLQLRLRSLHTLSCSGFSYTSHFFSILVTFTGIIYWNYMEQERMIYLGVCIPRKMKGSDVMTLAAVSKRLWSPVVIGVNTHGLNIKRWIQLTDLQKERKKDEKIPWMQQWIGLRHGGLCCQTRLQKIK